MTQSNDTQETKQFYADVNRNVLVNLPISGTQLKLRPATSRDLDAIAVVVSEGLDGKPVTGMRGMIFHAARLLTPVKELRENEDAWKSRYEQLNGYDFDAEDLEVLLEALMSFRSTNFIRSTSVPG